jgi:hypothetical protein
LIIISYVLRNKTRVCTRASRRNTIIWKVNKFLKDVTSKIYVISINYLISLGKVMFKKVDEVKGRLWKFTDLEDVISKYNIKSRFDEE